MWTLVLVFHGYFYNALASATVPGFLTEVACQSAGKIADKQTSGVTVTWICLKTDLR